MRIYVGNLPYSMSEDELKALFASHGQVDEVEIPMDRDSGRPRGFGFVTMPDGAQANAAIAAIDGKDSGGRTLRVNEARPRR